MKTTISIGQAYRPTGIAASSRSAAWVIANLYTGTDGRLYAKLVNAADSTDHKTIGVDALSDTRLFTPAAR
jgi:hypothetical protein